MYSFVKFNFVPYNFKSINLVSMFQRTLIHSVFDLYSDIQVIKYELNLCIL